MRKKTPQEPRESSLASGWTIESAEADDPRPNEAAEPATAGSAAPGDTEFTGTGTGASGEVSDQLPNIALVFFGLFGGIALLYAWVWLSWAQFYASLNAQAAGSAGSLGSALQQFVFWLAPLAPILWFAAALLLNRGSLKRTVLWILIGAVVLLPLPVFSGAGA